MRKSTRSHADDADTDAVHKCRCRYRCSAQVHKHSAHVHDADALCTLCIYAGQNCRVMIPTRIIVLEAKESRTQGAYVTSRLESDAVKMKKKCLKVRQKLGTRENFKKFEI